MRVRWGAALMVLACVVAAGLSARAESPKAAACRSAWPQSFGWGKPFSLYDPRSGLTLHVEGDGRHMAAVTRNGKVRWHRDVFGGPKMQILFVPPPQIEGRPALSPRQLRRQARAFARNLGIDRIQSEPDCMKSYIDRELPTAFRGHYIRAGSGTHIFWLMDATSGDIRMEQVN